MIVCQCQAISDRQIRQAVREGARTRGDVEKGCGAGARCGGCHPTIEQILEEERQDEDRCLCVVVPAAAAS